MEQRAEAAEESVEVQCRGGAGERNGGAGGEPTGSAGAFLERSFAWLRPSPDA